MSKPILNIADGKLQTHPASFAPTGSAAERSSLDAWQKPKGGHREACHQTGLASGQIGRGRRLFYVVSGRGRIGSWRRVSPN